MCYNVLKKGSDWMAKVSIKSFLHTEESEKKIECDGILTKEKLTFYDGDTLTSIEKKKEKWILKRKNKEYEIEIPLILNQKTKGSYHFFHFHKKLDLQIDTNMLEWGSLGIQIKYQLKIENENLGLFHYHIEFEVKK